MIALLLANWRLIALGLLMTGVLSYVAWANHEHHAVQVAKAQVKAATAVAQQQAVIAKATDTVAVKTVQIQTRTEEVVRVVREAPGADTPLPDGVRSSWFAGLSDGPEPPAAHRPG